MADKIRIFALGGLDEAGKNLTVVEINDDIFVLDCGFKFPNKNTPGIDCLIPNPDYIVNNKDRLRAYIITHAHEEQMGALPYFYRKAEAPVYTTLATSVILDYRTKNLDKPLSYNYHIIKATDHVEIAGRELKFFQTCHNAVDSFGVAIPTDKGYIVYTGEFIVDHDKKYPCFNFDLPALAEISNHEVLLLMTESYSAASSGYTAPYHRFIPHIKQKFQEADGRIFIAGFWQNFYGVFEFVELCLQNHKRIVFYDMRTKLVVTYLLKAKMIDIPRDSLIDYADVLRYPQKELVFLFLGHGEELFENIQKLCHRKNEDKRIFLTPDDTFFLCAPPSDNIEDLFTKTVDELFKTQAKIIYLKRKEVAPMHAREEDLKFILSYLKPKYYLPIRGSYSQMLANAKLAVSMGIGLNHMNVFILENGLVLNFDEAGHPSIRQDKNIDTTELIIDGFGISNTNRGQIEARNAMSVGGIVVIASTISLSKRKMITKPDCQMRGFVFVKDAEPILKEITSIYIEEVEKELKENSSGFDNEKVTNTITDRANKTIQRHLKRNPLLLPLIFEVE